MSGADVLAVGEVRPGPTPVSKAAPAAVAQAQWPAYRLDAATTEVLFPPERVKRIGRGQALATVAVHRAIEGCAPPPEKGSATAVAVGTALAEEGDEIAFLENMVKLGEKGAKPAFFVNSVKNALASQIALQFGFQGENQTFSHDALSFEDALWQGARLLAGGRARRALVCGVDALVEFQEIHGHLLGHYRLGAAPLEPITGKGMAGTVPGEGAAAFLLAPPGASEPRLARLLGVKARGPATRNPKPTVAEEVAFLEQALASLGVRGADVGLLLLGANGDAALDAVHAGVAEALPGAAAGVYKHATGDFATASALGLALAVRAVAQKAIPEEVRLVSGARGEPRTVVHYHLTAAGHHTVMAVVA